MPDTEVHTHTNYTNKHKQRAVYSLDLKLETECE